MQSKNRTLEFRHKVYLEVTLHTVHRRVIDDVAEPRVLRRQVDGVRVEDHVEHHAPHILLVKVIARGYQRVRDGPLQAAVALLAGRLAGGSRDHVVLADVQEALPVAVHTGLNDVTGLGVNERHVYAPLLLELGDLSFVGPPVVRVGHLLRVLDQQLAKLLLLQAVGDVLQFLSRHAEILPVLSAGFVHVHLTSRVFTNSSVGRKIARREERIARGSRRHRTGRSRHRLARCARSITLLSSRKNSSLSQRTGANLPSRFCAAMNFGRRNAEVVGQ